MFENKLSCNGIYFSRYIASWRRMGGKIYRGGLFERWLREQQKLTEEEISAIFLIAENGKLELQNAAKQFMEENAESQYEERKVANFGGYFEDGQGGQWYRIKEDFDMETAKFQET